MTIQVWTAFGAGVILGLAAATVLVCILSAAKCDYCDRGEES